jgi:hypothetical protein
VPHETKAARSQAMQRILAAAACDDKKGQLLCQARWCSGCSPTQRTTELNLPARGRRDLPTLQMTRVLHHVSGAGVFYVHERVCVIAADAGWKKAVPAEREGACACWNLPRLTFELTGRQRQDARPGPVKMYRVPPARAWWPAVAAPVERGVRPRCSRLESRLLTRHESADLQRMPNSPKWFP